jgi:signal transduction histidine kinase
VSPRKPQGRLPWGVSIHPAAEPAVAFLASAVFFLIAAAATPVRHHLLLILLLGGVYLYVVLLVSARRGPLYGVPLAIAGGLAFDSFFIPPTRQFGDHDWQNELVVVIYVAIGTLIGALAARSQRRAEASEEARGRLAQEQAALRRVATLVAREADPSEVFAKVAEEVALLLGVGSVFMHRYEPDGGDTVVGSWGELDDALPVGTRLTPPPDSITAVVRRTGRPARNDDFGNTTGPLAAYAGLRSVRSAVGSPIIVDGELWGSMVSDSLNPEPIPADAESRIAEFTELVATSISNIQARAELAASRARIVAATDDERRRVVRDLHDGAQQRLVHTVFTLKQARTALQKDDAAAAPLLAEALDHAESAMDELRELAHGILPSVLSWGGLRSGVEALASRTPLPVEMAVSKDRYPAAVEATAYFVVAEALTNVVKHAQAEHATVAVGVEDGALRVEVADDGTGTADPHGHGLLGLADRLASLEGELQVVSAPGHGTKVIATLPLGETGA